MSEGERHTDRTDAFRAGARAAYQGDPVATCPYETDTPDAQAWLAGYRRAQAEEVEHA